MHTCCSVNPKALPELARDNLKENVALREDRFSLHKPMNYIFYYDEATCLKRKLNPFPAGKTIRSHVKSTH